MKKSITSRSNPAVKSTTALHHTKHRQRLGQFIAQGLRTCSTLIATGLEPIAVYVTHEKIETLPKIFPQDRIHIVSTYVMEKMSTTTTPSGLLCIFPTPKSPSADKLTSGIVLARISDPGNMGTLIRTCAAMNYKSVVCIQSTDPYNPKVVQASAGTIGQVNIFNWSWPELHQNKKNQKLCALVVQGGKKPAEVDFTDTLLVIGSEAHGIGQDWLDECDLTMTLPMPGGTESLNAAVAGSIALYLMTQK